MHVRSLFFGLALLAACSSEPGEDDAGDDAGVDPGMDAGGETDGGMTGPIVRIGTGQDMFQPLTENQMVELSQGTQGGGRLEGYHIWSAVRVKGFNPSQALVEFRIIDETGTVQAQQERLLSLQPTGEFHDAFGIAPRIMDCCAVADKPVTMAVQIEDMDGLTGTDEISVMAGPCVERNSGQNLCP